MRTLATIAAVALTIAGCTTTPTAVEGSPPIRQLAIAQLPQQPAHGPELPLEHPAGPMDRSDPAAVAVALIVAGLAEEGLEVTDLGAQTVTAAADAVTVRVAAAHQAEDASMSHTSVYELHLTRLPAGSWRLVGYRQAH